MTTLTDGSFAHYARHSRAEPSLTHQRAFAPGPEHVGPNARYDARSTLTPPIEVRHSRELWRAPLVSKDRRR